MVRINWSGFFATGEKQGKYPQLGSGVPDDVMLLYIHISPMRDFDLTPQLCGYLERGVVLKMKSHWLDCERRCVLVRPIADVFARPGGR